MRSPLLDAGFTKADVRALSREMGLETWGIPYDEEIRRMLDDAVRERIVSEMKGLGFRYVTLDLQGYRTGSMNEVL